MIYAFRPAPNPLLTNDIWKLGFFSIWLGDPEGLLREFWICHAVAFIASEDFGLCDIAARCIKHETPCAFQKNNNQMKCRPKLRMFTMEVALLVRCTAMA